MKKCSWCGKEYSDEATFCAIESQPLERIGPPSGEVHEPSRPASVVSSSPQCAEAREGSSPSGKSPVFGVMSIAMLVIGVISLLLSLAVGGFTGLFIGDLCVFGSPVIGFAFAIVGLVQKEQPNILCRVGLLGNVAFPLIVLLLLKIMNAGASPLPGEARPFGDL